MLKAVRGASDHRAILSCSQKNRSQQHTQISVNFIKFSDQDLKQYPNIMVINTAHTVPKFHYTQSLNQHFGQDTRVTAKPACTAISQVTGDITASAVSELLLGHMKHSLFPNFFTSLLSRNSQCVSIIQYTEIKCCELM